MDLMPNEAWSLSRKTRGPNVILDKSDKASTNTIILLRYTSQELSQYQNLIFSSKNCNFCHCSSANKFSIFYSDAIF